jgi:hypothetical protein
MIRLSSKRFAVESSVASRQELLRLREKVSQQFPMCTGEQCHWYMPIMAFNELPSLSAFTDLSRWTFEADLSSIPTEAGQLIDMAQQCAKDLSFTIRASSECGGHYIRFGWGIYCRQTGGNLERLSRRIFSVSFDYHDKDKTVKRRIELLKQMVQLFGHSVPPIDYDQGRAVWRLPSDDEYVVSAPGNASPLVVTDADTFYDFRAQSSEDNLEQLSKCLDYLKATPVEFSVHGVGEDKVNFEMTRQATRRFITEPTVWTVDLIHSKKLRPEAEALLSGGPFVNEIDFLPFFQMEDGGAGISLTLHSIKHVGNDRWKLVSMGNSNRVKLVAWLRSLSSELYPSSIEQM